MVTAELVQSERGRGGESERMGERREWRVRWWRWQARRGRGASRARKSATRRRGPHAVGRARRCRCGKREEGGEARAAGAGLASLAGPVGWRRPASEQPPFPFFLKLFFPNSF